MDDTNNPTVQTQSLPAAGNQNTQQDVTAPISGINKEILRPVSDFVKVSEAAPVLESTVKEAGVEAVAEKPNLTQEHKDIGINHSLENNIPNLIPSQKVKLPLTEDEIGDIEKEKNPSLSAFWLSVLIKKIKKTLFWEKQYGNI